MITSVLLECSMFAYINDGLFIDADATEITSWVLWFLKLFFHKLILVGQIKYNCVYVCNGCYHF